MVSRISFENSFSDPLEYGEGTGERPDFLKSLREQEEIEDDPELLQKQKKDQAEEDMYFKNDGAQPTSREETIWFFFRVRTLTCL